MNTLLDYITKTYHPLSVIVYGSYADGTNNANSDFDALVIVSDGKEAHNTEVVENIQMDLWVYPSEKFQADFDAEELL